MVVGLMEVPIVVVGLMEVLLEAATLSSNKCNSLNNII